jgi:hypothetical protein
MLGSSMKIAGAGSSIPGGGNLVKTAALTVAAVAADKINLTTGIGSPKAQTTIITVTNTAAETDDEITEITCTAAWVNCVVELKMATVSGGETLTITDGTGLLLSGNFVMDKLDDVIGLRCTAANTWQEIYRTSGS